MHDTDPQSQLFGLMLSSCLMFLCTIVTSHVVDLQDDVGKVADPFGGVQPAGHLTPEV